MRRDHDDVVLAHLDVLVLVRGHERQRAQRLALRPGADDADLTRCVAGHLFDVDDAVGRDVEQTHLAGERDVVHHRPAEERDPAAGVDGRFADLLHAMQVRRERRDDEPAIGIVAERRPHGGAHRGLRRREAGTLGVRGVGEQQLHAAAPPRDLADEGEVGLAAVDGREVELEVAAVQDGADGRVIGGGERVRHRVRDRDELAVEGADPASLAVVHGDELGAAEHPGLFDAVPGEAERQR